MRSEGEQELVFHDTGYLHDSRANKLKRHYRHDHRADKRPNSYNQVGTKNVKIRFLKAEY